MLSERGWADCWTNEWLNVTYTMLNLRSRMWMEDRWSNGWFLHRQTNDRSSPAVRPPPRRCWSSGHPRAFCTGTKGHVLVLRPWTPPTPQSACIKSEVQSLDLQFPLKNLSGKPFNYAAEEVLVHICEFSRKKKTDQMFSHSSVRRARLFFHLETFCLTTADIPPGIPWTLRSVPPPGYGYFVGGF